MDAVSKVSEYHLTAGDAKFTFLTENTINIFPLSRPVAALHSHQMHELFFVTQGALEIKSESGNQNMGVGDLAVVPSELLHTIKPLEETHYMNIMFSIQPAKRQTKNGYVQQFSDLLDKNQITVIRNFDTMNCFERLRLYQSYGHMDSEQLIMACLQEIIFLLKNKLFQAKDTGLLQMRLENIGYRDYIIDQYINEYGNKTLSLAELSEMVHLSPAQLQRIIKKLYNQSFRERILFLKMQNAKQLIRDTDLPMQKIADMVGYASFYSFYGVFKKYFGLTPSQYREKAEKQAKKEQLL